MASASNAQGICPSCVPARHVAEEESIAAPQIALTMVDSEPANRRLHCIPWCLRKFQHQSQLRFISQFPRQTCCQLLPLPHCSHQFLHQLHPHSLCPHQLSYRILRPVHNLQLHRRLQCLVCAPRRSQWQLRCLPWCLHQQCYRLQFPARCLQQLE